MVAEGSGNKVGRLIGRLVRLPLTILGKFEDVFLALAQAEQQVDGTAKPKIPNSIDNLKASDPFVKAAAQLPIEAGLKYHSIIAQRKPDRMTGWMLLMRASVTAGSDGKFRRCAPASTQRHRALRRSSAAAVRCWSCAG